MKYDVVIVGDSIFVDVHSFQENLYYKFEKRIDVTGYLGSALFNLILYIQKLD